MAKKLTKKQIKEMENKQEELRKSRSELVESLKGYWRDVDATKRYYQINNMKDKLNYYNDLADENERRSLLHRYKCLKDFKVEYDRDSDESHTWTIIRNIVKSYDGYFGYDDIIWNDSKFEKPLLQDDLYFEDILWGEKDVNLLLKYMKKYGYNRIQYFCSSTGVAEDLYYFTNKGLKIVDTNAILRKPWSDDKEYELYKTGLIIEFNYDILGDEQEC